MPQVLKFAQRDILRRPKSSGPNLITAGYRLVTPEKLFSRRILLILNKAHRESTVAEAKNHMLENHCVNTIVTALQAPEWETLLARFGAFTMRNITSADNLFRIGDGAMLHLLKETSVFMPLPNECLCQMTGQPLVNVKPIGQVGQRIVQAISSRKIELKRKASDLDANERPTKRVKLHASVSFASNGSLGSSTRHKSPKPPP